MNRYGFAGAVALSVATLLAGSTIAQVASQTTEPHAGRHARLDTDKDGKISQAEFVQTRTARLTALDGDRDGTVSAQEVQAARTQRAAARFDRIDTDRNGHISRSEFDAPREQGAAGARGEHRGPRHAGRRMGPDGEGRHGPAERMAQRGPVAIADVQTRATEAFGRMDANRDGFLTTDEMQAARAAKRGDRVGRRMDRPMVTLATPASPPAPASE